MVGLVLLGGCIVYFIVGNGTIMVLSLCVVALSYTIGCKKKGILINPVAKFLGGISFEIYLCHMVIYRGLEKLHLIHVFENELLSYIFTSVAVVCGSVVFSVCVKCFLNKVESILKEKYCKKLVS